MILTIYCAAPETTLSLEVFDDCTVETLKSLIEKEVERPFSFPPDRFYQQIYMDLDRK